ncbi:12385_t:CDS:10 [Ambispora gerdemannii]|uniref:12385_t:CDS:1 n=1 Tax=Ambispora gerdemannii TaxID=144530 RepID=A0A9N8YMU9_9GLOM|nr:12385_t:CDS:10 [Ambispora gerdemannii]
MSSTILGTQFPSPPARPTPPSSEAGSGTNGLGENRSNTLFGGIITNGLSKVNNDNHLPVSPTSPSTRDFSRSAVPHLRRLSTLSGKKDFSDLTDLNIPTITENREDVTGLKGRIRLQKDSSRRNSRTWMDQQRKNIQAYEYLCHIGEAKEWIEACVAEEIEPIVELEESLRNGIVLAKLAKSFEPTVVRRIFTAPKLQFRHSDNINFFFIAIRRVGLPDIFWFELTDLYEKKNIPRKTPQIRNLIGKLEFTEEQLSLTQRGLDASGIIMPSFANVGHALAAELNEFVEEPKETDEEKNRRYWNENLEKIIKCQAYIRAHLARHQFREIYEFYRSAEPFVIRLQAQTRGWIVRSEWNQRKQQLDELEKWAIKFQAHVRGSIARRKFRDRLNYFRENIAKVVKIQSIYRAKKDGDAYRSLTMGSNPPIGTIKNFIHLLNDSDFDFEEEIKIERLRQDVIQRIRTNNQSEKLLNKLDIKIALLVKNRITLDEVIAVANPKKRQQRLSQLQSPGGPFSLKSLDKESRQRLELYQQFFYFLQTKPVYLARLFFIMNKARLPDKTKKMVEGVVLTLFGYAQNAREEFLLLKLFQRSIWEELESVDTLQEFMRGNFMFMKLVVQYNRGAKERKFLRELLGPMVKSVMDDYMDLETDPLMIYRNLVNAEELRSGQTSSRPTDITQTEALNDPETRTVFIHHLQRLRKETEMFLNAIISSLPKIPYGIRYISRELKAALMKKFPNESEDSVMKVVGHLVYYRYLNPAIVAPEGFDVIETVVSPMQRKNLAEISKMLNQISVGRLFTEDNMYLQPLNDYVGYASKRFADFFTDVTKIQDPEVYFDIDEYNDLIQTHKPIIYISPFEVFSMHAMFFEHLEMIIPEKNDALLDILKELGDVPPFDEEYLNNHNSPNTTTNEISLTLTNRLQITDSDLKLMGTDISRLFVETKRYILSIIRVQTGNNLLDILIKPVTPQDEQSFKELLQSDRRKNKRLYSSTDDNDNINITNTSSSLAESSAEHNLTMYNISRMTFSELKKITLQNVLKLEAEGKVSRQNNYQDLLNAIAVDIRNNHRRRVQRERELKQIRQTLSNLEEKRVYLDDQIKSYNDYIEVCMQQLSTKKGKKSRVILPFTRQYFHIRDLQRNGRVPKFGSYKYTAQRLHEKGVLISIDGYSLKQFDKISFTISSDVLGLFSIEAAYMGISVPGGQMELRLEELLQGQFNNVQVESLMDAKL